MSDDKGADAIGLTERDNVATVLRDVAAGERLIVRIGAVESSLTALEAVPLCHKISLAPLKSGDRIVKYGQVIGAASRDIPAGSHIHIHNMASLRARLA
jgi:altronate dehydratase small subunit